MRLAGPLRIGSIPVLTDPSHTGMGPSPDILASSIFPGLEELNKNMKSAYEYGTQSGEGMMGLICMFNKIKVDKGLDWCPRTNSIIGVCREHSGSSPYVFSNLDDAQVICEDL